MATIRTNQEREMELADIQKKLEALRAEHSKIVSKSPAAGIIDNPGEIKELKRTIARVLTILNEKTQGEHK